ncbi:YozE family protein [Staphylococcus kloosii]|uniref:YozE SAM-like domain-containing protein n=1 Tax=Staphylococcus kloosii TaxID=29384 RepID=A0ABQ0XMS0_9STAP|nr:YozE family protein [Staphylococcus kloosii]AVQ34863.1 hypothetical protein C7J89_01405 [Staphylococcus kloosii]PNZ01631.1 hypothetical protein CD136_13100 [Staphylococcus kloosii]GEP82725.1 hypothetical protein SKL01_19030 [Staphylococcus kloosii]SUM50428.1 Putative cytosolic protein [Staphylococcus kloosii]
MTFYDFIQTFRDDNTPLGKLAHWIEKDDFFPKDETAGHNILEYFQSLHNLEHEIIQLKGR